MKLQLYYDPWLHYLTEIMPNAVVRDVKKRCREKVMAVEDERTRLSRNFRRIWKKNQALEAKLKGLEEQLASAKAEMDSNNLLWEMRRLKNLSQEQEIQVRAAYDRVRSLESQFESLQR